WDVSLLSTAEGDVLMQKPLRVLFQEWPRCTSQCDIPNIVRNPSGEPIPNPPDQTMPNHPRDASPNELLSGTKEENDKTVFWNRLITDISS
ncbi:hypothetical protein AVEN_264210-1, partial [Araneus ventricosus]